MSELRLIIPKDLAERLAYAAAVDGTSAEALAADVICRHASPAAEADRQGLDGGKNTQ